MTFEILGSFGFWGWTVNGALFVLLNVSIYATCRQLKSSMSPTTGGEVVGTVRGYDSANPEGRNPRGRVSGDHTAIMYHEPGLVAGLRVQSKDEDGRVHSRVVVSVDRLFNNRGEESDLSVVTLNMPWPEGMKKSTALPKVREGGFGDRGEDIPRLKFRMHKVLSEREV